MNGNDKNKIRYNQERGWWTLGTEVVLLRGKQGDDLYKCVGSWSRRTAILGQNVESVGEQKGRHKIRPLKFRKKKTFNSCDPIPPLIYFLNPVSLPSSSPSLITHGLCPSCYTILF